MALSDILNKIEEEAKNKIANLEKDFEKNKATADQESKQTQKATDEEIHQKVEENSGKILEKAETLAEMESKNMHLQTKRKLIEEVLNDAIEELSNSSDYEKTLAEMMKNADLDGDDVKVVPAKGKEEATKKAIKESGKPYTLDEKETANIQGGFVLKTEKIEINNSFETIIKNQLREGLEIKLNKLLF